MENKKEITMRIGESLYKKITEMADNKDVTISNLLNDIIVRRNMGESILNGKKLDRKYIYRQEPNICKLSFYVKDEVYNFVKASCEINGVGMSEFCRSEISQYFLIKER